MLTGGLQSFLAQDFHLAFFVIGIKNVEHTFLLIELHAVPYNESAAVMSVGNAPFG